MRSTLLSLSASVAVASAALQLQSSSQAFIDAAKQGCISASANADGAPVVIHDCNTEDVANHSWDVGLFGRGNSAPEQIKVFGNKCLDVTNGVNTDGTKLQIWTCDATSPNQSWISVTDRTFQWAGTNKCIDLTDGNITDGNQLQIWTCDSNNLNQRFTGERIPNDTSRPAHLVSNSPAFTPVLCLAAETNNLNAWVSLAECDNITSAFPAGNGTFVAPHFPLVGPIKTYGGTRCLDILNGNDVNGNLVSLWSCEDGNPNQQFRVNVTPTGQNSIEWVGHNKCIDVTNGDFTVGNHLQIWDCDSTNNNQVWFVNEVLFN